MSTYKYSIIIPHRNIPDLLKVCLDSIPERKDVQVIVVDDNSDSDKVNFSEFPGWNRPNTEVILTKEGRGAGYARNVGMKHAKGEWLLFADADDYFEKKELNSFMDMSFGEYEVVGWAYRWIKPGQTIERVFEDLSLGSELLYKMKEPWKKMVKKSFLDIHQISFQESTVANDLMYSMEVAYNCQHFYYYKKILYNWILRKDSLSAGYSGKKLQTAFDVVSGVNRFLKKKGKEQYLDRAHFYLSLMWDESKFLYYYNLIRYAFVVGIEEAKINNIKVCQEKLVSPNPVIACIDSVRVRVGKIMRGILR